MAAAAAHAAAAHAAHMAGGPPAAWDGIWQQQQQGQMQRPVSTGWADEFAVQRQQQAGPGGWAEEFSQQQEGGTAGAWVQGFEQEQQEAAASRHGTAMGSADAQATSARLVAALTADGHPKMKNSKFLQFLSKMSKGELMFEDNKVTMIGCPTHACSRCWAFMPRTLIRIDVQAMTVSAGGVSRRTCRFAAMPSEVTVAFVGYSIVTLTPALPDIAVAVTDLLFLLSLTRCFCCHW
jgi:hypothetical protein